MASLLVDTAPVSAQDQATPDGGAAPTLTEHGPGSGAPSDGRSCANCSTPLADGQEWCVQCGQGLRGSLRSPDWRAPATVFAVVLVLVLGAAAAAYAALNKGSAKPRVLTTAVARTLTPATPAPSTTPTTPATVPTIPRATVTPKPALPLASIKPPKIPLTAAVPNVSEKSHNSTSSTTGGHSNNSSSPSSSSGSKSTGSAGENSKEGAGAGGEESQQAAILLDTNAASTYNPYNYPASNFGDPSLAIDGDHSTAWTAQVNAATAPNMAEGLLIDLKEQQRVAAVQLVTSTPGMTVQVYGTSEQTAPNSITSPAWTPLTGLHLVKKKNLRLALRDSTKAFTFITLWISRAPSSSTPENPGHVAVNELELFPAK